MLEEEGPGNRQVRMSSCLKFACSVTFSPVLGCCGFLGYLWWGQCSHYIWAGLVWFFWQAPPILWQGFLDKILCAEEMRRCSTRDPCRHQPVPVFVKTLASEIQGGRVVLKRNRTGNQVASQVKATSLLSLSENRVFRSPGLACSQKTYVFIPGLG